MNTVLDPLGDKAFSENELVTWHYSSDGKQLPVPAVVLGYQDDQILIKARVQGKFDTFVVAQDQLVTR
jgi:hypothetical protein